MSEHMPPSNVPAEDSLLGAIMLQPSLLETIKLTVVAADFYQPKAQELYNTMLQLHDRGMPVDVVTISGELRGEFDRTWLMEIQNETPSISRAPHYANMVIAESRRRQFIALGSQVQELAYAGADPDEIMQAADPRMNMLVRPRNAALDDLMEIAEWEAMARQVDDSEPWLIPHLAKRRWRIMVVAGEGVGKMTLLRQIGLHAAAGLDPWDASRHITPIRVTHMDFENSASSILHQNALANRSMDLVKMTQGRYSLFHREQGIDIRNRVTRSEIEAVIQRTKPDLVVMGPLYKMFRRNRSEDWETPAGQVAEILDDLRTRYNCAIMIEAHAAKASQGAMRELTPFGSSVWSRWCETGVALNDHGQAKDNPPQLTIDVEFFRPPRDIAEWPDTLSRGGQQNLAWSPSFHLGRGGRIGARFIDGEWTYKPHAERTQDVRAQVVH